MSACDTKLKFVEIVMISVSDLAPALAILWGYNILVSTLCPLWKNSIIYAGNVYIKKYKDHFFNHCVAWFYTFVKQQNRTAFILNCHFNTLETDTCLNKFEKLPCIVSIVYISK